MVRLSPLLRSYITNFVTFIPTSLLFIFVVFPYLSLSALSVMFSTHLLLLLQQQQQLLLLLLLLLLILLLMMINFLSLLFTFSFLHFL